jgi:3-oxoacyl-[acyl-carrier protein] reductase
VISIDLSGKTALISGGARGIGAAVCRTLARAGARVAILDLDDDGPRQAAEALKDEIRGEHGAAIALTAHVEDFAEVQAAAHAVVQEWQAIDILVTCAGTTSRFAVSSLTSEEWARIVEINLSGTYHCVKAALPHMDGMRRAAIVLIGSAAIVAGSGGGVHYAASKAALEGLCRGLTRELAPQGIRTNLVHPSLIDTDLLRKRHPDPDLRRQLAAEVPLQRLGRSEDIANMVLFLVSDLASYVTGQSIYVDGGRTLCK